MAKYNDRDPIHRAVELRQIDRVQELLRSGMKADARDSHGMTPLMVAVRHGYDELLDLLVNAGAKVNAKDRASAIGEGRLTALHHACSMGKYREIKWLLEKGADPDALTQSGRTPFTYVADQRELAMLVLEHKADPNGPNKCADPPIVEAAAQNDLELIRELLKRGADPNRVGKAGNVALAVTVSIECARELLRSGADINLKNGQQETPLLVNLMRGSVELIRCYIEAGADVNAKDKDNGTVIMRLTNNPRIEIAALLIAAGAEVNAMPWPNHSILDYFYGSTSHYLINERIDLITFLESKGAKRAKEYRIQKRTPPS